MTRWSAGLKGTLGFVPTLGALHEGHESLIKRARRENDVVAVSVFVNPLQFTPEGFKKYPRNLAADAKTVGAAGAAVIFAPSAERMYPAGFQSQIILPPLFGALKRQKLEWHYRGVLQVVLKLIQIVLPDRVYFGLKDPHQLALIERFVFLEATLQAWEAEIATNPESHERLLSRWIQALNCLQGLGRSIGIERVEKGKGRTLKAYLEATA